MARKRVPTWRAACAVTLAFGLTGQVSSATAEDATPTPAAKAKPKVIEEMVVTGSHIKKAEGDFSTPVLLLSNESIEQQGSQNIADILYELPSVGTPGSSRSNTNFATVGNGVSTINLRNLGDKRSLVLVNGRRLASGVGGTSTVDLNNIPTDLIERVEVITGGASAAYGSEAIAGVVNFVLKDNFEGFRARVQSGKTSAGDNGRPLLSLTGGYNFLEHGNVTLNVQIDKDKGLASRNRSISKQDKPRKSSFTPQGRFAAPDDSLFTYNPDNTLKEGFSSAVNGYNRNSQRFISVPIDRKLYSGLAHYDFSDLLTVYFEGTYAKDTSNSQIEAFPSANSDALLPDGSPYAGLTPDNPFIPAAILAHLDPEAGDVLQFRKRLTGVFDRSNKNDRNFYHYVVGAKGTVFEQWDWDVYASTSKTKEDTTTPIVLANRFFFALDAIANPAGGAPMCRDAAARAAGCAPFNPFGFNSASAASANYITAGGRKNTYTASIQQDVVSANVTGALFKLPAGDVKMAAGLERRKEKSSEKYGPEVRSGNVLGNALTNTSGNYDVTEAYVELNVPILRDMFLARSFDLEGAARSGDYSTVGKVFSYKLGGTWSPIDSVKFRAVYAKATRAPNIGELFQGASQTFPTSLSDPCDGTTATTPGALGTYCRSIPGIAQQVAKNGVFTYDPNADTQSIQGFDGGNKNLGEETAKTTTVGVVLTPEFAPTLSLSVDWFRVKINEAITLVPRQTSIDQCVNSLGSSPLCALITREAVGTPRSRTPGTIFNIDSNPVNAASIETSGIDVASRYHLDFDQSAVDLSIAYTYLSKLKLTPLRGQPSTNNCGQLDGDGRLGAGFKHRANFAATYTVGGFSATWRTNYLSAIKDTLLRNGPSLSSADNSVEPFFYNDMQVRYNFGKEQNYDVYLGVDNVFDRKPPFISDDGASVVTGTLTAADTYDPIGRFIYAGFEVKL